MQTLNYSRFYPQSASSLSFTAYLRFSTSKQDAKSQKHGIKQFAKSNGFNKLEYVEDTISEMKDWRNPY